MLQEVTQYFEVKPEEIKHVMIIWMDPQSMMHYECDKDLSITQTLFLLKRVEIEIMRDPE